MNNDKIIINKITISNLWKKYKIEWSLNPDVNILIGKNGTGKSSILDIIEAVILTDEKLINKYVFDETILEFSNKHHLHFRKNSFVLNDSIEGKDIKKMFDSLKDDMFKQLVNDIVAHDKKPLKNKSIAKALRDKSSLSISNAEDTKSINNINENHPNIIKISTFDMELQNKKAIKNYGDKKEIQTELDLILHELINDFKLFQLKLKNKVELESEKIDEQIKNIASQDNNELLKLKELVQAKEAKVGSIFQHKDEFKNIVNKLFSDTQKTLQLDENNSIVFEYDGEIISPYQLSSGEKQILMILLTVILQEDNCFVLLMDEPEISLHVEWQKDFLDSLVSLNSNMQIILATHSPAIVLKGWKDKITKISDIIFKV